MCALLSHKSLKNANRNPILTPTLILILTATVSKNRNFITKHKIVLHHTWNCRPLVNVNIKRNDASVDVNFRYGGPLPKSEWVRMKPWLGVSMHGLVPRVFDLTPSRGRRHYHQHCYQSSRPYPLLHLPSSQPPNPQESPLSSYRLTADWPLHHCSRMSCADVSAQCIVYILDLR